MRMRWSFVLRRCSLLLGMCLLMTPAAKAQYPVIDISAIKQLISEIKILEDQLTTARAHLAQAVTEYNSMTGDRGMERLLSGQPRNYLPSNWADLQTAMQSGGGALGSGVAASVAANSVLPPQALALLPPDVRTQIDTARHLPALQQNLTRQA